MAPEMANQADAGAWFNACSAQGANAFPYGNTFLETKCNGAVDATKATDVACGPLPVRTGFGCTNNGDLGVHTSNNGDANGRYTQIQFPQCSGGVTGLYHMSGNVAEWENSCEGVGAEARCRVRGGSYDADGGAPALACAANRTEARVPSDADKAKLADVGFRCCLY